MATWSPAIDYKYRLFREFYPHEKMPSQEQVRAHYAAGAAKQLKPIPRYGTPPARLRAELVPVDEVPEPMIVSDMETQQSAHGQSHLVVADLLGPVRRYSAEGRGSEVLFTGRYPATLTLVDLDADGLEDVVVGELGR